MDNLQHSHWFIKLRWFAFVGQLVVLWLAVALFELTLPWPVIVALLGLIPLTNLLLAVKAVRVFPFEQRIFAFLVIDTLILTAILYLAGGPMNPFSIVYMLHVVLAAILLSSWRPWAVTGLACLAYGFLFLDFREVPEWHVHAMHHGFSVHLHGMWFAFILTAGLVTYFVAKIVSELRVKERRLERLETISQNQQRLTSLTTLTAGAAHELGTPLATLAVVAHELERQLQVQDSRLAEDVALIKSEIERCKAILQKLALTSGDVLGEQPQDVQLHELLYAACADIGSSDRFIFDCAPVSTVCQVPRSALLMSLKAILKNAVEAGGSSPVQVVSDYDPTHEFYRIMVSDCGSGMSEDTLQQLGQPFFSTKGPKLGMGLGFYLAKLVLEQLGGRLEVKSKLGQGSQVLIYIPTVVAQVRQEAA